MELKDLKGEEQLALVALLNVAVLADGTASPEERGWVEEIADVIGDVEFEHAQNEVERRFPDETSLKAFLRTITRQPAREVIFGTVFEMSLTGAVEGHESDLLTWLAKEWKIEITFENQREDEEG